MSFFDDPPLHDFPDRAIRLLQAYPAHLRELVADVAPRLAPLLDFDRTKELGREFPLADWRQRSPIHPPTSPYFMSIHYRG